MNTSSALPILCFSCEQRSLAESAPFIKGLAFIYKTVLQDCGSTPYGKFNPKHPFCKAWREKHRLKNTTKVWHLK